MTEYDNIKLPNNSYAAKNEDEKSQDVTVDKVVTGEVKKKKKGFGRRLLSRIIAEDFDTVVNNVVDKVIIPSIVDTASEAVSTGADIFFHGLNSTKTKKEKKSSDYTAFYGNASYRNGEKKSTTTQKDKFEFDDVAFKSRGDAEQVLDEMCNILRKKKAVSVADYYRLCGTNYPWTAEEWGWTDLGAAYIRRIYGSYIIILPKAEPLDEH